MSDKYLVKVHNLNEKAFVTTMNDVTYTIPGHGFIEVSRKEAMDLKHGYSYVKRDGVGNDLMPRALRLQFPVDENGNTIMYKPKGGVTNKSMLDGKEYPNSEAMVAHILANANQLENVELAMKAIKGKGKSKDT